MTEDAKDELARLVDQFGDQIADDAQRCQNLLRDALPDQPLAAKLLGDGATIGVAAELRDSIVPASVLCPRLVQRLQEQLGLSEDSAKFVVAGWAHAFGQDVRLDRRDGAVPPSPTPPSDPKGPETGDVPEPHPTTPALSAEPGKKNLAEPTPTLPSAPWGPFTTVNGVLAVLCVWIAVIGFAALSNLGAEDLCHVHVTGRPPFVWIRQTGWLAARAFGTAAQSCHVLATQFLGAAAAGLFLSLAAWRKGWF